MDEGNINLLLQSIDQARKRHEFQLCAYVIMPEHVHLLVRPVRVEYRIADILKAIKQPVARKLAAACGKPIPERFVKQRADGSQTCKFWQPGGGYDRNLHSPKAIWAAIEYIRMNPVKRGLVEFPEDYEWSSCRAYLGQEDVPFKVDRCDVWLT